MVAESPGDGGGENVKVSNPSSDLWLQQREFNIAVSIHQTDIVHLYSRLIGEMDELRAQIRDLQEAVHMLDLMNNKKGGNNDY